MIIMIIVSHREESERQRCCLYIVVSICLCPHVSLPSEALLPPKPELNCFPSRHSPTAAERLPDGSSVSTEAEAEWSPSHPSGPRRSDGRTRSYAPTFGRDAAKVVVCGLFWVPTYYAAGMRAHTPHVLGSELF